MKTIKTTVKETLSHTKMYLSALIKWLTLAAVTGVFCGVMGSLFHIGVDIATKYRNAHPWLLWLLPIAGLAVVGVYKITGVEGQNTNDIIDAVHLGSKLSIALVPAIFIGTVLTHLCGGSAGREGAALQMGGDIGHHVGKMFRLDDRDMRTATLCGMAAFFSALFGVPLASTIFAIVVISVGVMYHVAFIPCLTASLVAYKISLMMGVSPTRFTVAAPPLESGMMFRVAALGALCAGASILFCKVLHVTGDVLKRYFPNPWLRITIGGVTIIGLTYLTGTTDYNGAGMDVILRATQGGRVVVVAFLLKILFTAITLESGFKGGEVVPAFFIGATLGCAVGPFLGIPAGFAAALGLVSVFCGAVNCPMASIFMSIELFGAEGLIYFAISCGIAYMLSGYNGLYSSQTILYSKLKAQYINARTNRYRVGQVYEHHDAESSSKTEK